MEPLKGQVKQKKQAKKNNISFPQNIIPFPRNHSAGTEPLICHLIYWNMKTIFEVAVLRALKGQMETN